MVLPAIIGLILFIVLLVLIGFIFTQTVLTLALNGIIIYLIAIRMWVELKKGRFKEYAIGGVVALVVYLFKGNLFSGLWKLTTFLIIWFIASEIIHYLMKFNKKKR